MATVPAAHICAAGVTIRMDSRTITTDIVLVDVASFSELSDDEQLVTAMAINDGIKAFLNIMPAQSLMQVSEIVLAIIPTGDGFYVILREEMAGYGPLFALSLRNDLLSESRRRGGLERGIRVAVHYGTALPFVDATGKENYVGQGLNDCERLLRHRSIREKAMAFVGDRNYVIVSRDAWERFASGFPMEEFGDFLRMLAFRFSDEYDVTDHHGRHHVARILDVSRLVTIPPPRPHDAPERIRRSNRN